VEGAGGLWHSKRFLGNCGNSHQSPSIAQKKKTTEEMEKQSAKKERIPGEGTGIATRGNRGDGTPTNNTKKRGGPGKEGVDKKLWGFTRGELSASLRSENPGVWVGVFT